MKCIVSVLPFTEEQKKQMKLYKEMEFIFTDNDNILSEQIKKADAIIGNVPLNLLKQADNLKWLQLNSAGYEEYLADRVLKEEVILTNASGAYGVAVAEHLLSMVVALAKKIPSYRDYQNKNEWVDLGEVIPLHDLTILIVGLGDIGCHFAKLMKALGNKIIGIKNNISLKPEYVDEVYRLKDLEQVLGQADIVVLTIPSTSETIGLMNEDKFNKMKKQAYFFNVGRGSLVDSKALKEALDHEIIAGAGIDVTEVEPLPKSHELWSAKNLLLTPHCAGGFRLAQTLTKIQEIALYNLEQFANNGHYKNKVR